jgi:two-component system, NtrC family, sensor kinase
VTEALLAFAGPLNNCHGGMTLVARWPIRIKLLAALVLLTAIVGTLAFSGFWGLYGYRELAGAVSEQAAELPLTSKLTRNADTLRDSFHRIRDGKSQHLFAAPVAMRNVMLREENNRFHDALASYRNALDLYSSRFSASEEPPSYLTDKAHQVTVVEQLYVRLAQINMPHHEELWTLTDGELESLQTDLNLLVDETESLPQFLHERMAGFRNQVKGRYRTMITLAWSSLVAAFFMLGTLLWFFRRMVVKPFRRLLSGSRLVASGNLDHRINMGTGDEFSELAAAMNSMTDRFQRTYDELDAVCRNLDKEVRDRTREVIQREQLASVGFLAAGVAHEINNPLASIAWSAEALESRLHDLLHTDGGSDGSPSTIALSTDQLDSLRINLKRIQEEAFRCKGITERLLDFSRMGDVRRSPCDLTDLIQDVVAMVGTLGQYRCKTIRFDTAVPVVADVNSQQIKQVVLNLLTNALESVDKNGAVEIQVRQIADTALISVQDNGCGMTDEVRENLFEPFFTRRRDGRGTGLGLSITCRIVNQHGGQISAHSDGPGCGSRLEVLLPTHAIEHVESEKRNVA